MYTLPPQVFPDLLLSSTYPDPKNPEYTLARSEVERRDVHIERLVAQVGHLSPLVQLVKQCLHNAPGRRPASEELLCIVRGLKVDLEGGCGGGVVKQLEIGKVLLAKEMKMKEVQ